MNEPLPNIFDLDRDALQAALKEMGHPAFRAKQIWRQLYVNRADSFDAMTDLSKGMRADLAERFRFGALTLNIMQSGDGGITRKALFDVGEGITIETVLMVYPGRATVCVSSQAGCPMGCTFCATGKLGHLKDLTAGEMAEQVLWASRELDVARAGLDPSLTGRHKVNHDNFPKHITNVVYMGMGEPFNNYDEWYGSVERLHDPEGFNLGARSFTVSTVGLIPGIDRLADEALPINLAISLHAADDAVRGAMMPVNRKYPISELLQSVKAYTDKTNRRVSFEYVLIEGNNDTPEEAELLVERLMGEDAPRIMHVNLIPWNPISGTEMRRSARGRIDAFRDRLVAAGISATVRIHRGLDIDAACGQLAGSAGSE